MLHTGQEVQPVTPHIVGAWYEKLVPVERDEDGSEKPRRTMRFILLADATRAFSDRRHLGSVMLEDGSVTTLAWRLETTRLYPGWWRRQWEKIVGNPLLKSANRVRVEAVS